MRQSRLEPLVINTTCHFCKKLASFDLKCTFPARVALK